MNVRAALLALLVAVGWVADASPSSAAGASHAVSTTAPAVGTSHLRHAATWAWPVAGSHRVETPFESPANVWSPGHRGIDVELTEALVFAPADGVVHFSGVVVDRPVLSIDHGDGVLSSFEPVSSDMHRGDAVVRGELVGSVEPGHCTRVECLHIGARVDGVYVSPLVFLGGAPSVLLPTRRLP